MLEKALYENFVAAFSDDDKRIINREVECKDCALGAEYEAFVSSKLATSYKSSILKLVSEARKLTQSKKPHPCFSFNSTFMAQSEAHIDAGNENNFDNHSLAPTGESGKENSSQAGPSAASVFQTASELLSLSKGVNKPFKPPAITKSVPKTSLPVLSSTDSKVTSSFSFSNKKSEGKSSDSGLTKSKNSSMSSGFCTASELELSINGTSSTEPFSKYSVVSKLFGEESDDEDNLSQQKYPESFKKKPVNLNDSDSPTVTKNLIDLTADERSNENKRPVQSSSSSDRVSDKASSKKNLGKRPDIPKIVYFFERKDKEAEEEDGEEILDSNNANICNLPNLETHQTSQDTKSKSSSSAYRMLQSETGDTQSKKLKPTSSSHSKHKETSNSSTSSGNSKKRKTSEVNEIERYPGT